MATSYFEEHDVEGHDNDRQDEESSDSRMLLGLARRLLESGYFLQEDAESLFPDMVPPPTSSKFLSDLEETTVRHSIPDQNCPICLKDFDQDDVYVDLPCKHRFHSECVVPWLKKTSSCPLCRHSLPTDDPHYEEMKRQRKRKKQREQDIEDLHNSMFG